VKGDGECHDEAGLETNAKQYNEEEETQ